MQPQPTENLVSDLAATLDPILTTQLLAEYVSQERRYILGDWEPATLDGGQFVEAAARIVYHVDSGRLDRTKPVGECLTYVEDTTGRNNHAFPNRKAALHLCKVLRTIYKFRSDRGAVHIDPNYTANELDSRLVIEDCKWALSELLRIFWSGERKEVARAIREILRYEVPAVGRYGDELIVQRTDCDAEEEILILIRGSGECGLTRLELGRFVRRAPSQTTKAIKRLEQKRQLIKPRDGRFRLTDIGMRRIVEQLSLKMSIA